MNDVLAAGAIGAGRPYHEMRCRSLPGAIVSAPTGYALLVRWLIVGTAYMPPAQRNTLLSDDGRDISRPYGDALNIA